MSFFSMILQLTILLCVAAALVGAGAYALFGKPKSRAARERQQHVSNGFRLAGGILLGFAFLGTFLLGVGVAFFELQSSRLSSRPIALVLAVASFGLMLITIQRWARYFAGFIVYGVYNGLSMAISGHLLNNPAIPVRRSWALAMVALTLVSALSSLRFTADYRLNLVDKAALMGWITAFAVAGNAEKYGMPAITAACVGLVLAWLYSRSHAVKHRRTYRRATTTRTS